ncbi:aminotransferase class V-fold PLP-dependent enzyme [Guptibacillus algicola]|uniref:aminotransferase class V-fold PLP-dependent enzyme n=1 Tax=Guptibacillus algicola TaxID=225844 RepID=UPI001CD450DA|nr:aminotransferase class V-fold PLP-dependent enzyme [Alkalihalobacillus algicola]MCA0988776.1 aminotransferase class V-fold PLP-dependent enzyme [Alkalihalobacillus algicola]
MYLDQAATSFPKPPEVVEAMTKALTEYAANPGRSGHRMSVKANEVISQAREQLADFFGFSYPNRVCFTSNATSALNQALKGFRFQSGDHVLTTSYEHNSVRRPLENLKEKTGIKITYFDPGVGENFDMDAFERAITPHTKMIVVSHGSNLTGKITPIDEIGKLAKESGIAFLVDAAQTAGVLPINLEEMNIDLLAFPGHKGLLGPQGTGVLMVGKGVELDPIFQGGTGSRSESTQQPAVYPEFLESGTLNTPGIAGLLAGLETVKKLGLDSIYSHELQLTQKLIEGLRAIDYVTIYGPQTNRLGVVPFTIEGIDGQEIAIILDQHYNIAVRAGLHCTPIGHESIGTSESGAVRISVGPYNTEEEIEQALKAIEEIVEGYFG